MSSINEHPSPTSLPNAQHVIALKIIHDIWSSPFGGKGQDHEEAFYRLHHRIIRLVTMSRLLPDTRIGVIAQDRVHGSSYKWSFRSGIREDVQQNIKLVAISEKKITRMSVDVKLDLLKISVYPYLLLETLYN